MRKRNKFSLFESVLLGLAGFAIGGLTTLIINTIQTSKIKNNIKPTSYNFHAILEPAENKKIENKKGN